MHTSLRVQFPFTHCGMQVTGSVGGRVEEGGRVRESEEGRGRGGEREGDGE